MKIIKITLLFILLTQISFAEEKIIRISTLYNYPPYCMKTNKIIDYTQTILPGSDAIGFGGIAWDIVRESYQEMGYEIVLSIYPWERAKNSLEKGSCDVLFPAGINSERLKIYNFSTESVNHSRYCIYVRKNDYLEWKGLESLKGRTIAVVRGFNYGDKWNDIDYFEKYNVTNVKQGFLMLQSKRVDGFSGYEETWDYILEKMDLVSEFKKFPSFDSSDEYVVSLKVSSNTKYLEDFDKGIKLLREKGELEKIYNKWSFNEKE